MSENENKLESLNFNEEKNDSILPSFDENKLNNEGLETPEKKKTKINITEKQIHIEEKNEIFNQANENYIFEEKRLNKSSLKLQLDEFSIQKSLDKKLSFDEKEKEKEKDIIKLNKDKDGTVQVNNININNTTYINNSYSDQPYKKEKVIDNSMSVSKQKSRHTFKKDVEYQRYMFKVILLGNIAVGKTCLLSYFLNKVFKPEYTCTVGIDFKVKTVFLENNKSADLQIWDTSGEERFKTVTRQYYRDASGIVLVYDVTNEKSFADVVHWIDDIKISSKINVSIVLVGNKTDLEEKRVVSFRTASNYAAQNNIRYLETSAKSGFNVSDLFEDLSQIMINVSDIEEANKKEQNNSFAMYKDEVSFKRKEINVKKKNCC